MNENFDPLDRLEAVLPHLQGAVNQQHLGKALEAAAIACADLPQRTQRLKALAASFALLPGYLGQRAADIGDATDTILDFGETMEGAAEIEDLEAIGRDVRRLDPALGMLHRSVIALAESYAREHIAPLSALERLLRRLNRDEVANAVSQLRVMDNGLASAGLLLPEKLKALQDAREALAQDLNRLSSDPEVDAFLTGFATSGSVTLSLVTKNVLNWLRDQSALDQFTVHSID